MTALADQQLAGLLMWVPMGVVYFGRLPLARRPACRPRGRACRSEPGRTPFRPRSSAISRFIGGYIVVSLFASTSVWAQGRLDTGAQTQGPADGGGTVQVGAGTKGDVTPGVSGPQKGRRGHRARFGHFRDQAPGRPLLRPGSLPIQAPQARAVRSIGYSATRQRCEQQASKNGGKLMVGLTRRVLLQAGETLGCFRRPRILHGGPAHGRPHSLSLLHAQEGRLHPGGRPPPDPARAGLARRAGGGRAELYRPAARRIVRPGKHSPWLGRSSRARLVRGYQVGLTPAQVYRTSLTAILERSRATGAAFADASPQDSTSSSRAWKPARRISTACRRRSSSRRCSPTRSRATSPTRPTAATRT